VRGKAVWGIRLGGDLSGRGGKPNWGLTSGGEVATKGNSQSTPDRLGSLLGNWVANVAPGVAKVKTGKAKALKREVLKKKAEKRKRPGAKLLVGFLRTVGKFERDGTSGIRSGAG